MKHEGMKATIVIAYDTTEGQTQKIAQYMGEALGRAGHDAQVIDIRRPPSGFSPDGFDAILVGASIHLGKHSRHLAAFVRRHKARLEAAPTAFFSVSLSAAGTEKQKADADRCLNEFLRQVNWTPTVKTTFAGGLAYRKYGFLKRWIMKRIARDAGVAGFSKRRYPAGARARRVHSRLMTMAVWLQTAVLWSFISPLILLFQSLPEKEIRTRIRQRAV